VVSLGAGTFTLSATGAIDVAGSLTIAGAGSAATTVNGTALDRVFDVIDPAAELTLTGLTVSGGNLTGAAAGIRSVGPALRLSDVLVTGMTGASAIELASTAAGSLELTDSSLRGNLTTSRLVDLHPAGAATLTLTRSSVLSNTIAALAGAPAVIEVQPTAGAASVSLDHATLQSNILGGTTGAQGLLDVAGSPAALSIADSTFSRNTLGDDGPGAVHVAPGPGGATVTVARSQFDANTAGAAGSGRGAAIAFGPGGGGAQSLTVSDSSFTNNVAGAAGAGSGGAIDFAGAPGASLAIAGSTFAFNRAGPAAGAAGARGAAVAASFGTTASVVNSTFSANLAPAPAGTSDGGGALWLAGGSATIVNATIADNTIGPQGSGGGIMRAPSGGPVTIRNTILAGNTAGGGPSDCGGGTVTTGGHNLEGGITCGFATELQGSDPLLGPLADNGGPTATRMPGAASHAIDGGDPATCPATDQRGVARPQGAACDIGAVEAPAAAVAVATAPGRPVVKATPEPRPRLRATDVIRLPSTKRCVSHRRFTLHIRRPKGMTLTAVRVYINGVRVRNLRGRKISSTVTLKRVPQGRFEVSVSVLTGGGAAVSLSRTVRYRTCARKLSRR
jgi:hypothetical protein